jgi:hypothetical protein
MDAADFLKAGPDDLKEGSCTMSQGDATHELGRQKAITKNTKECLVKSIEGAVKDLDRIVNELSSQAKLGNDTSHINSMLYNSLLMLIDELDYIGGYIERIENSIDMACFDVAKKLNEAIVHLIGHRKDILFKVIETTYKIHDYIIKWKRIVNDTNKIDNSIDEGETDYIEGMG